MRRGDHPGRAWCQRLRLRSGVLLARTGVHYGRITVSREEPDEPPGPGGPGGASVPPQAGNSPLRTDLKEGLYAEAEAQPHSMSQGTTSSWDRALLTFSRFCSRLYHGVIRRT